VILLLFSLAVPIVGAWLALRPAWPERRLSAASGVFLFCLAAGAGLGLSSCCFFLWYPLLGHPGTGFIVFEVVLLALLIVLAVARLVRPAGQAPPDGVLPTPAPSPWAQWLWVPFTVSAALVVRYLVLYYAGEPHGEWDACMIWNLRARFLYRVTDDNWRDTFTPLIWHTDYPLFVPATVARCWLHVGEDWTLVPFALALLLVGLTAGLLVSGLNLLRSGGQGWLAGTVLLCSSTYVHTARMQYADVPLGFFLLATAVCFTFHDRGGRAGRFFPALAGAMAGFAAWTKNEGLLFLAAAVLARLVVAARERRWRVAAGELAWFGAGLAPAGLTLLYFKTQLAPPNDLVAGQGASTLARIGDLARHEQILRALATDVWQVAPYMVLILAAYALLVGRPPVERRTPGVVGPALLLAFMAVGYYLVYLTTPYDLAWHLRTSSSRLVAQLWPLTLFALFLATGTLEEAAARHQPRAIPASKGEGAPG
jgi:hypothetical protein